jgi:type IV pilus assembly protein PilX
MSIRPEIPRPVPNDQRGAVLFISLILLVVLALIGIAGMQVTTLQERMAGNYYTIGRAFENSEWGVRTMENTIQTTVNGGAHYYADDEKCGSTDMDGWSANKTATASYTTWVARIDGCFPAYSPIGWNKKKNEDTTSIYQITSAEPDTTKANMSKAVSMVAVQSVYIP